MAVHATVKRPKKSLASLRKKHEQRLLSMPDAELKKEIENTYARLNAILARKR